MRYDPKLEDHFDVAKRDAPRYWRSPTLRKLTAEQLLDSMRVATAQRYHICGACRFCRSGRETLCPERKFLGDWGLVGGYGEYVAVEDDNVAGVPDGGPLRT